MAMAFAVIFSILTITGYLLQGLNEEKENRVMEILLSSVSPDQLMLGKLLGLGRGGNHSDGGVGRIVRWTSPWGDAVCG